MLTCASKHASSTICAFFVGPHFAHSAAKTRLHISTANVATCTCPRSHPCCEYVRVCVCVSASACTPVVGGCSQQVSALSLSLPVHAWLHTVHAWLCIIHAWLRTVHARPRRCLRCAARRLHVWSRPPTTPPSTMQTWLLPL